MKDIKSIKKPAGRPPRAGQRSDKLMTFAVTTKERERLRKLATQSDMSISDFIRYRVSL